MRFQSALATLLSIAAVSTVRADYADLVTFFASLQDTADAAIFPVLGRGNDDIESAFGPRIQSSTDNYDWHRGIDVDGTLNTDPIVAPLKGYFYDYRYTAAGGNIVILEHHFADFNNGAVTSISYGGKTLTKFYTWHLHLFDDGVAANATGTGDIVSAFTVGQAVARGTQIGVLGDSGSSGGEAYAPHLHFELRMGTNSSLEFQLANPGTTQWSFDPHMNPLLLFADAGTTVEQSLTLASGEFAPGGGDLTFDYALADDDSPVFNRLDVRIRDTDTNEIVASHVLELNQRLGYDATSTATLDDQGAGSGLPYIAPDTSPFSPGSWATHFVVPEAWLAAYAGDGHDLELVATDIWGNATTLTLAGIPEPGTAAVWTGFAMLGLALSRRRRHGHA